MNARPQFSWDGRAVTGSMTMSRFASLAGVYLLALSSCSASPPASPPQTAVETEAAVQTHVAQPDPLVQSAQIALIRQGYLRGAADGYCGPQTRAAIADFEHAHALPADGRCSPSRLHMLNSHTALAGKTPAPQATPAPVAVMDDPANTSASSTGVNPLAATSTGGRRAVTPVAPAQAE